MYNPAWWSAVSGIGVLILAVYVTFFSNFSNILEASLRAENASLISQSERLQNSISIAENELQELEDNFTALEFERNNYLNEIQQLSQSQNEATLQLQQTRESLERAQNELHSFRQDSETEAQNAIIDQLLYRANLSTRGLISLEEVLRPGGFESLYTIENQTLNTFNGLRDRLFSTPPHDRSTPRNSALSQLQSNWINFCGTHNDWVTILRANIGEIEQEWLTEYRNEPHSDNTSNLLNRYVFLSENILDMISEGCLRGTNYDQIQIDVPE